MQIGDFDNFKMVDINLTKKRLFHILLNLSSNVIRSIFKRAESSCN